ncbi:hypothetical protein KSS87_006769 [Heliosperma pusillum]|nr:hypothetical protein KSS87_006769 [Heliosperma pusillum]
MACRAEYSPEHDLLDQEFLLKGKWYQRKDLEIKNHRGDVLQCSHYITLANPDGKALPCVIYCHGNSWYASGCRADASEAAIILLPLNISVFTLDFSGSGLSGGEHVTLGWNEKDDLKAVVEYLRSDGNVSTIGLWGRSMGAVTSLMYGAEDPSIAGMVLDSPFSDLVDLMMELVDTYKVRIPKFTSLKGASSGSSRRRTPPLPTADDQDPTVVMRVVVRVVIKAVVGGGGSGAYGGSQVKWCEGMKSHTLGGWGLESRVIWKYDKERRGIKFAIQYMRRAILKKAKFDIMELNTIKVAKKSFVPVLFGHAIEDDFIQPHHSERIFDVYMGDKNIIKFDGDHNSPRLPFYFDSISIFFNNVLQPPQDEAPVSLYDPVQEYIDKATWNALHGLGYTGRKPSVPTTSGSGDAIEQLRSKRPMSRMEVPATVTEGDELLEEKAEVEAVRNESPSSSSRMINFELANGQPYGPHVPISIDDNHYIEYPLDSSTDFPRNFEDEERMVMEAIMESLKDMRLPQPPEESPSHADSNTPNHSQQNHKPDIYDNKNRCESSKTDSTSRLGTSSNDVESPTFIPNTNGSSSESPYDKISSQESCSENDSTDDKHGRAVKSPSLDPGDGTKATLTVVKNSTGNIMDGFFRRRDWNIFKSTK